MRFYLTPLPLSLMSVHRCPQLFPVQYFRDDTAAARSTRELSSLALPCSRQIHLCERAKREKVSLIDPGVAAEEVGERERERPVLSAEEGYSKDGQWSRPRRETTSRSLCIACNPYEAGKTVVKVAKEGGKRGRRERKKWNLSV